MCVNYTKKVRRKDGKTSDNLTSYKGHVLVWLKCLCIPKIHMLKSNSKEIGLGGEALGR